MTPYMKEFTVKLSRKYVGLYLRKVFQVKLLINRMIHVKFLVFKTIVNFRRHVELKKDSVEILFKNIKNQLEDTGLWESRLKPDKKPKIRFKISDQMYLLTEYVTFLFF